MKNNDLSNNKILITGGATGIGLGLTERFLNENNTVVYAAGGKLYGQQPTMQ